MKTMKFSGICLAFLIGLMCITSCKSIRLSFLGVFHFQKQFEAVSDKMSLQDSVMVVKDGSYQGSGGSGRIFGAIQSSDSMLVVKARVSYRWVESTGSNPIWGFLRASEKGVFEMVNLPFGTYDISVVNVDAEQTLIRNVMLSDSVPEVRLNIVLNQLK